MEEGECVKKGRKCKTGEVGRQNEENPCGTQERKREVVSGWVGRLYRSGNRRRHVGDTKTYIANRPPHDRTCFFCTTCF